MKVKKCGLIISLLSALVLALAVLAYYFCDVSLHGNSSSATVLENPAYVVQAKDYNNYAEKYVPLQAIKYMSYGEVDGNTDQTKGKYHVLKPLSFEDK